jgi:molybdopterin synthase catalytic subunit
MDTKETATITVTLLLFAQYREALGGKERELEIQAGTTPSQALARVSAGNPQLEALRPVTRYLVNSEFVGGDEPLRDGDELAFVPPVAGG